MTRCYQMLVLFGFTLIGAMDAIAQVQSQSDQSEQVEEGQLYVENTFRDWQIHCIKRSDREDPCHIYQLIKDSTGHPIAEVTMVRVQKEEGISAAGTIMTPLETLLTANLVLQLDNKGSASYPFSWCDKRGCHARIAFSDDDIFSMRRGRAGTLRIESIAAPGEGIELPISFLGFTGAFGAL